MKDKTYRQLGGLLTELLEKERDFTANTANTSALLAMVLLEVNWAGFYFLRGEELVLGPFQGHPACTRIPLDKGVCGKAARERRTVVVPDVRDCPFYVPCDTATRSEIVLPLIRRGRVLGVLDVNSPVVGRFDAEDAAGLECAVCILLDRTDFPKTARGLNRTPAGGAR
jgi:L-methionine (R)-S-oxide reductase